MMNVKEIVAAYLKDHGFDGLVSDDGCGCRLGDLFPCEAMMDSPGCAPAYVVECGDTDCEFCDGSGHLSTERKPIPEMSPETHARIWATATEQVRAFGRSISTAMKGTR